MLNNSNYLCLVGGKPIVQHGLEYIRDVLKINKILLVVGYQKESSMEYFGNGKEFGLTVKYIVQHLMEDIGTKINSSINNCEIIGPFYIGHECILENSIIGPFATIGSGTKIVDSKIEHSVILENSTIANNKIKYSVIGSKCIIQGLDEFKAKVGDYSSIKKEEM